MDWKDQRENYIIVIIVPKRKNVWCCNCGSQVWVGSCEETLRGICCSVARRMLVMHRGNEGGEQLLHWEKDIQQFRLLCGFQEAGLFLLKLSNSDISQMNLLTLFVLDSVLQDMGELIGKYLQKQKEKKLNMWLTSFPETVPETDSNTENCD